MKSSKPSKVCMFGCRYVELLVHMYKNMFLFIFINNKLFPLYIYDPFDQLLCELWHFLSRFYLAFSCKYLLIKRPDFIFLHTGSKFTTQMIVLANHLNSLSSTDVICQFKLSCSKVRNQLLLLSYLYYC